MRVVSIIDGVLGTAPESRETCLGELETQGKNKGYPENVDPEESTGVLERLAVTLSPLTTTKHLT